MQEQGHKTENERLQGKDPDHPHNAIGRKDTERKEHDQKSQKNLNGREAFHLTALGRGKYGD